MLTTLSNIYKYLRDGLVITKLEQNVLDIIKTVKSNDIHTEEITKLHLYKRYQDCHSRHS